MSLPRKPCSFGVLIVLMFGLLSCGGGNDFPEGTSPEGTSSGTPPTTDPQGEGDASAPPTDPTTDPDPPVSPPQTIPNPSDTQRPQIALSVMPAGGTVSGTAVLLAEASDNVGVTGVQFTVDGTQIGADASSPYSTQFDTTYLADGSHTFGARASDAAGNTASATQRRSVANSCKTASPTFTPWHNASFSGQSGAFTAQVELTPRAAAIDGVFGLSNGSASARSQLALAVRFAPDGRLRALNGGDYAGSGIAYAADQTYRIRLVVNVPSRAYSVYVTAGGTEQVLAQNFAFSGASVSSLNNRAITASQGAMRGCNFSL